MTAVNVSWDAVTEDDSGSPVTNVQYEVFVDGVSIGTSAQTQLLGADVAAGSRTFEVAATAAGVTGPKSAPLVYTVPSGVPNAPINVNVVPA